MKRRRRCQRATALSGSGLSTRPGRSRVALASGSWKQGWSRNIGGPDDSSGRIGAERPKGDQRWRCCGTAAKDLSVTPCSSSGVHLGCGRLAPSPRSCNLSCNQEDPAVAGGGASGGRHRRDTITTCFWRRPTGAEALVRLSAATAGEVSPRCECRRTRELRI